MASAKSSRGRPPEALIERFQELTASLERIEDPLARRSAEELIGVVLDLYGEGLRADLRRLVEEGEVTEASCATRLADDGVVASLMLIHDLYPVDARGSRAGGARRASGPTWSRTAATSSSSTLKDGVGQDPARRQLRRLPGLLGDARAGDQAGARRARSRPRGARGRGRHAAPPGSTRAERHRAADRPGAPRREAAMPHAHGAGTEPNGEIVGLASWFGARGRRRARGRRADRRRRRPAAPLSSPTSTARCSPIATAAPTAPPRSEARR